MVRTQVRILSGVSGKLHKYVGPVLTRMESILSQLQERSYVHTEIYL